MTKRKEAVDPFGLSLLDVLSNALGGLILLMLIVAVTIKGNDEKRLNLQQESSQGENYTVITIPERLKQPKLETDILIAQIKVFGGSPELSLAGAFEGHCSLSKYVDTLDTKKHSSEWLVIRKNKMDGDWEVRLDKNSDHSPPDSIAILITWKELVTCHEVLMFNQQRESILRIKESLHGQPEIFLLGKQTCNMDPK